MTDTRLEVAGLYRIIPLKPLRRTPGVWFDLIPIKEEIPRIDSMDRVIHVGGAVSPGPVGGVERPWYMHPHQDDNLVVLHGTRHVDVYTPEHGRIESFTVTPNRVERPGGEVVFDGPAMLVWPRNVFHRIVSAADTGSASLNLAVHYPGWDKATNFNIYAVDTEAGTHTVLREGHLDQP